VKGVQKLGHQALMERLRAIDCIQYLEEL